MSIPDNDTRYTQSLLLKQSIVTSPVFVWSFLIKFCQKHGRDRSPTDVVVEIAVETWSLDIASFVVTFQSKHTLNKHPHTPALPPESFLCNLMSRRRSRSMSCVPPSRRVSSPASSSKSRPRTRYVMKIPIYLIESLHFHHRSHLHLYRFSCLSTVEFPILS